MAANQSHKSSGRKNQAKSDQGAGISGAGERARRYASEMGDEMSRYVSRGTSQVRDMTRNHEGTAVMVALATGFGVGLMIGAALGSKHSRPQSWRDRIAAEGLGRRLMERVESIMPDAITEYIHR